MRSAQLRPAGRRCLAARCSSRCTSRMNSWKCSRVLRISGTALEEAVHQEALAAPDAAVHVDAARDRRPRQQLGHRVAAPRLVVGPFVLAALERVDRAQLCGIALIAAFGERAFVELADGHVSAGERVSWRRSRQKFNARLSTASAASLVASRQRRVGVADARDVLGRRLELHRHHRLGDQLATPSGR